MNKAQEIEYRKAQLNRRIKELENKFEGHIARSQKKLSYTQKPSELITKHPFTSILVAGSLGLIVGVVRSKLRNNNLSVDVQGEYSRINHGSKDNVGNLLANTIRRRLIQLILDKGLDEAERMFRKQSK